MVSSNSSEAYAYNINDAAATTADAKLAITTVLDDPGAVVLVLFPATVGADVGASNKAHFTDWYPEVNDAAVQPEVPVTVNLTMPDWSAPAHPAAA